jgi:hypothetical protein
MTKAIEAITIIKATQAMQSTISEFPFHVETVIMQKQKGLSI